MPGGRSTGCSTCRARKIKCDEARPACAKCLKLGAECQYRDELDLAFKDENKRAATLAKTTWRQRVKHQASSVGIDSSQSPPSSDSGKSASLDGNLVENGSTKSSSSKYSSNALEKKATSPLLQTPEPLVEQLALGRFFADYVVQQRPSVGNFNGLVRFHGHMNFLPELYSRTRLSSCLHHTVRAASLANFANRYSLPEVKDRALESYCQALVSVKSTMPSNSKVSVEEMLTSVLLLCLFETITSNVQDGNWANHVRGGMIVLRTREKTEFSSMIAKQLMFMIHTQTVIACLSLRRRIPPIASQLKAVTHGLHRFGSNPECEPFDMLRPGPVTRAVLHEIIDVIADIQETMEKAYMNADTSGEVLDRMESLIEHATLVDAKFERLEHFPPLSDKFSIVDSSTVPFPSWFPERHLVHKPRYFFMHESLLHCTIWNMHRAIRICINHALVDGIDCIRRCSPKSPSSIEMSMEPTYDELRSTSISIINKMSNGISSSVFAMFTGPLVTGAGRPGTDAQGGVEDQSVRGYSLIWPLRVASWASGLSPDLKAGQPWMVAVLSTISKNMGINRAEAIMNTLVSGQRYWMPPAA